MQQWRNGIEMLGKPTFTAPSSVGNQVESHSAAEASSQLNFKPTHTPSQQFGQHSQHLGPLGQLGLLVPSVDALFFITLSHCVIAYYD